MVRRRKKKFNWNSVGDVLAGKFMGKMRSLVDEYRLRSCWSDIVGELLASKTEPGRLYSKTLVVNVASSSLSNQLFFLKEDVLAKIRRTVGNKVVEDIRFQVRKINPRGHHERRDDTKIQRDDLENVRLCEEERNALERSNLPGELKEIMKRIRLHSKAAKREGGE